MSILTQNFIDDVADFVESRFTIGVAKGRYTLDGTSHDRVIDSVQRDGDTVRVYLSFDQTFSGLFTKFELYDNNVVLAAEKIVSIDKPAEPATTLLVAFRINTLEQEV